MTYKVHPGIGVARIGNSIESYIGPTTRDEGIVPEDRFRDGSGRIVRQGGQFRVFEHFDDGRPPREIFTDSTTTIEWTVRLTRQQSPSSAPPPPMFTLPAVTVSGRDSSTIYPPTGAPLAELRLDVQGRLIILSAAVEPTGSNDGRCEGYVQARVLGGASDPEAMSSWVLIAPPDFAPARPSPAALPPTPFLSLFSSPPWSAPPDGPGLSLTEQLDRGPLSYVNSWDRGPSFPVGAFIEPFRFLPGGPPILMRNHYDEWMGDLRAGCSWSDAVNTDVGLPTEARGLDWRIRGFLVLPPSGTAQYVDWVPVVEPQNSLEFYQVPRGAERAVELRLGLQNFPVDTEVTVSILGQPRVRAFPSSFRTGVVAEHSGAPVTASVWVFFHSEPGDALGLQEGNVELRFGGRYPQLLPIRAMIVEPTPTAIGLVLDCSLSMDEVDVVGQSRLEALKDAMDVVVDVARPGDALAIAPFSTREIEPSFAARVLGSGDSADESIGGARFAVREYVRRRETVGSTSIGSGIRAIQPLLDDSGISDHAVIVVTDGYENTDPRIDDVRGLLTARTFAVGIGSALEPALAAITSEHEGYLTVVNRLSNDMARHRLEKYLLQILAGAHNDSDTLLDPEGRTSPSHLVSHPFQVSDADVQLEVSVVSRKASTLFVGLAGPSGQIVPIEAMRGLPGARVIRTPRTVHGSFPVPADLDAYGVFGPGRWTLLVGENKKQLDATLEFGGQTAWAADFSSLPGTGTPYLALVNTVTALKMFPTLSFRPGEFRFEAALNYAGMPLRRDLGVSVLLTGPGGVASRVPLAQDESGIFRGQLLTDKLGAFHAKFEARGISPGGHRYQREREIEIWASDPASYGKGPATSALAELGRKLKGPALCIEMLRHLVRGASCCLPMNLRKKV